MTPVMDTSLDVLEYLKSLSVAGGATEVYAIDGASLYRLNDDHYVGVTCTEHKHTGAAFLEKVLPVEWVKFAQARNTEEGFAATHYGPPWNEAQPA